MKGKMSLSNLSLKRRIVIAISLISLIPLIVLLYYFYGYKVTLIASSILSLIIILGWLVVFDVFSSIIKIYARSKNTLEIIGEETPVVPDEVQSLETIITLLSDKVKTGFEQLQDFTKMTGELNKEVSRKVLILSTILQANDLFSKEAPAEEVIKFLSYHLTQLLGVDFCFCNLKEDVLGDTKVISSVGIDPAKVKDFIQKRDKDFIRMKKMVLLDINNKTSGFISWTKDLGVNNLAIMPIISKGKAIGMIGIGSKDINFSFGKDDLDVLNLFAQNVTLIWEHERLSSKIEELEILDYLTGLYNEKMISKRLSEEIKRSSIYQRPCGFIALKIADYEDYQKKLGQIEAEKMLKSIAKTFKAVLRPLDVAGRIGPNVLGAVLIESNKRECQDLRDNLKKELKELCFDKVRLAFSIAESPLNGDTAQEVISFAEQNYEE
ncbi:MAG: diguanylate cyclase [Candidatus Omnitrophica bacterium]|jgi:diguanylate cyclase (GGDEF)-like protein|nr:diguanylate cyclase [Candidatus Omnitrophota bacterium]